MTGYVLIVDDDQSIRWPLVTADDPAYRHFGAPNVLRGCTMCKARSCSATAF
jgi:hypothetical protein